METNADTSRRNFVVGGLATVAAVGLSGCSGGGGGSGAVSAPTGGTAAAVIPLNQTEVSEWEKVLGNSFVIAGEAGSVTATLASLERIGADVSRPASLARKTGFYARFQMDPRLVPDGNKTYQFTHPTQGAFSLFLSKRPEGDNNKGVLLAVLN